MMPQNGLHPCLLPGCVYRQFFSIGNKNRMGFFAEEGAPSLHVQSFHDV